MTKQVRLVGLTGDDGYIEHGLNAQIRKIEKEENATVTEIKPIDYETEKSFTGLVVYEDDA